MGQGGGLMIALERKKSSKLIGLESLLRRLPQSEVEYEYFNKVYIQLRTGYEGELQADREWLELSLSDSYYLFHNFETVNSAGNTHQIDTLLLTPNFLWLLEIKNMTGRIDIDQTKNQLIRTSLDGKIESFKNPVDQIERHVHFLARKMHEWKINIPVEYAIVIVRDSTIIGSIPANVTIFHLSGLQSKINQLYKKHSKINIESNQLEKIKYSLLNMYHRKNWSHSVNVSKLRKGVLCEKCSYKSVMKFEYGNFICPVCGNKSKVSYYEALLDYRALHSEWISNRDIRDYLGIDSRYAVIRLLKELNLEFEGTYRNRKYRIPEFIDV